MPTLLRVNISGCIKWLDPTLHTSGWYVQVPCYMASTDLCCRWHSQTARHRRSSL